MPPLTVRLSRGSSTVTVAVVPLLSAPSVATRVQTQTSPAVTGKPGAQATIFWGARSFNYHSLYSPGVGLFLQGRYGFGDGKQTDAILGVHLDLEYFVLPALFVYEAIAR